jgi:hypothetical protein
MFLMLARMLEMLARMLAVPLGLPLVQAHTD